MATTFHDYNGDGSDLTFDYSFPTIKKEDVKVQVNNVLVDNFTIPNYTTSGTKTVTFDNTTGTLNTNVCESSGAPKAGTANVRIYRDTDVDARRITYQVGSAIKAEDLNEQTDQLIYAHQEEQNQTITTDKIKDGAVTSDKIKDETIVAADIAANAITTVKILNDAVTSDKIADGTIQAGNIGANAITHGKMADSSVGTAEIISNSIDSQHYIDGSIDRVHLEADIIDGTKLADNSVNSEHYVDGSIDREHLAADIVDGTKIADDSINSEHYVDGSIDRVHLVADIIDATKIADDAVTNDHLAIDSVASPQIRDNNITRAKILDGEVTRAKLQADCIDATKIEDNAIDSEHYTDGSIDRVHLEADIIDSTKLADNAVGTEHIADAELTTLAGMPSATASILATTSPALSSTIAELNLLNGKSIVTSISSPTDAQLPTAQAVEERIVDLVTDVGGFRPIANETSFPTTNPDPEDNAGTIVSVKALASNLTSNGSGVATIANGAGSGNTVTINGMANSDTIEAGKGILVETTSTLHTYTFHRETLAPADITAAQSAVTDFNQRYQVAGSTPTQQPDGTALAEGDLFFDTAANKMKVYDGSNYGEVTSTGDFKYLFLCPDGGTGAPSFPGASYDLREGSNSGSAANVTNAAQLIISINGVIQKANTGTSAPAEGFAMADNNNIKFGSNITASDNVFIVQVGSAVSIPTPGDNTVSEAKIQTNVVSEGKLKITNSPSAGKFLQTDGSGNMSWQDATTPVLTNRGDILTRSASAEARLALGTNGQTLQSNGTDIVWADSAAGATGGNSGANKVFWENENTVTHSYSITANRNAGSFGPITINNGVTVTIPNNSNWTII